jgi:glycerol-3-phosphate dehydrogenase (NAD(P)+)
MGVIGAGAWGTALARLLAECGHTVKLWAYEAETAQQIAETRINQTYFPGFELPPNLTATADLQEALTGAEMVLSVSPSHTVRTVMKEAGPYIGQNVPIVSASKGIENDTLMTVSEILEEVLPMRCTPFVSYLSGPSFSKEVGNRMPTAVVVAAYSERLAKMAQAAFTVPWFRVYTSTDVIGVELGGALKNVLAIGVGIAVGMGLGDNTRAAMITRGLNEMTRLAVRRGANPLTMMGLAGMGDLVLTCSGPLSRNRSVGERLGGGAGIDEILGDMVQVAEGVKTAKSVFNLARRYQVEMPLCEQVYHVIYEGKSVQQALTDLLSREQKREMEF